MFVKYLSQIKIQKQFITPKRFFTNQPNKNWFFTVDHKGNLYLDETEPKIYANALKDQRFLKNFYKNLKINKTGYYQDKYQYVSPCWDEFNYVKCEYEPIVFDEIIGQEEQNENLQNLILIYSQGFQQKFYPNFLSIDKNGLLYHKIELNDIEKGIIGTNLSVFFMENYIKYNEKENKYYFKDFPIKQELISQNVNNNPI